MPDNDTNPQRRHLGRIVSVCIVTAAVITMAMLSGLPDPLVMVSGAWNSRAKVSVMPL